MNECCCFCLFAEDQQALEDEGIVIPMIKPSMPAPAPIRNQSHHNLLTSGGIGSHHSNAIVPLASNQSFSSYSQSPFNNNPGASGFLTSNYSSNNLAAGDPAGRRKSIIDNMHPAIGESKQPPIDLLNAFPVSEQLCGRARARYLSICLLCRTTFCTFVYPN